MKKDANGFPCLGLASGPQLNLPQEADPPRIGEEVTVIVRLADGREFSETAYISESWTDQKIVNRQSGKDALPVVHRSRISNSKPVSFASPQSA